MSRPVLSICIPSFRRPKLLAEVLDHLDRPDLLPFPFDVIVVDNGSPEGDYAAIEAHRPRHYPLSYQRNGRHLTAIENWMGTLRRARGEFVMNLADDDRIDPDAIAETVLTMMIEPSIAATYCCWRGLDLTTGELEPPVIKFHRSIIDRSSADATLRSLLAARFLPEIGIYRTSMLARCLFPTTVYFWPFVLLERLLRSNAIHLAENPFYLTVERRADEPFPRPTAGQNMPFPQWDAMNRSFEMLVHRYCDTSSSLLDGSALQQLDQARSWFLDKAFTQHCSKRELLTAFELAFLIHLRGRSSVGVGSEEYITLCYGAALQAMAKMLFYMPEVTAIGLAGFDQDAEATVAANWTKLVQPDERLPVLQGQGLSGLNTHATAILARSDAGRAEALAGGWVEGKVFSLESLMTIFSF